MSFRKTDASEGVPAGDRASGYAATADMSSLPQTSLLCPTTAQAVAANAPVSLSSLGSLSGLATNSATPMLGAPQQSLCSLLLPSNASSLASLAQQQPLSGNPSPLNFASQQLPGMPVCRTLGSLTSDTPSLTALSSNVLPYAAAMPRTSETPSLTSLSYSQLGNRAQTLASETPSLTSLAQQQGDANALRPLVYAAPSLAPFAQSGNVTTSRPLLPSAGATAQSSLFPSLSALGSALPEKGAAQDDDNLSGNDNYLWKEFNLADPSTASVPAQRSTMPENSAAQDSAAQEEDMNDNDEDMTDDEDFLPLKAGPSTPAVPMKAPSTCAQVLCVKIPRREAAKAPVPTGKNVRLIRSAAPGINFSYYLDCGDIIPFDFSTPSPDELFLQRQQLGK